MEDVKHPVRVEICIHKDAKTVVTTHECYLFRLQIRLITALSSKTIYSKSYLLIDLFLLKIG